MPWVKSLLSHVFGLEQVVNSGSLRFIVIDGSTVQQPGANETTYRLHIAIDLIHLTLRQVELSTDKIGEHLDHYQLEAGDVVIVDRGYNQPKSLVPFLKRGGHVVLRYNAHSMNLWQTDGQGELAKTDWQQTLLSLQSRPGCIPVLLRYQGESIPGYVHAIPLPPPQREQARRKAKQRARKKGRTVSDKALFLSEWVFIFTSLTPEQLSTETAGALYRTRWQVELVIKRLKSLLAVDQLRARKESALAELYLYGKLLYAAVVEKIAQRRFPNALTSLHCERQLTPWRLWRMIADEMKAAVKGCFLVCERFIGDCTRSLSERTRKRPLQQLPPAALVLIGSSNRVDKEIVISALAA